MFGTYHDFMSWSTAVNRSNLNLDNQQSGSGVLRNFDFCDPNFHHNKLELGCFRNVFVNHQKQGLTEM